MQPGKGATASLGGIIAMLTPARLDYRSGGATIARMTRTILFATAVSGTLDIVFAMILTLLFGRQVDNMLRFVASGPFPSAPDWETAGAVLRLIVHFTLIAIMATIFVLPLRRFPPQLRRPVQR